MRFSCSDYVSVFKALSDETRLRIVVKLCQNEMCAAALLKNFAITRREGNWIFYSINPQRGAMVRCFLEDAGLEQ